MPSLEDIRISPASAADADAIEELLVGAELPTAGFVEHLRTFIVARDGERIVACGGAEAFPYVALIRSIAVDSEYRSIGLGRRMVRELLDRLSAKGLREFYLLTTTAEPYFHRRGFKTIDRDEIHPQLLGSAELQGACPDSAVCMRLVMR